MATTGPGNTISVFSMLEAFKRRKLMIVLPTLILAGAFGYYAYQQPDRYRAQSLVAAEHLTAPEYLRDVSPGPLNIQEHLWTVREVLFSPELLNTAAHGLKVYSNVNEALPAAALEAFKARVGVKV